MAAIQEFIATSPDLLTDGISIYISGQTPFGKTVLQWIPLNGVFCRLEALTTEVAREVGTKMFDVFWPATSSPATNFTVPMYIEGPSSFGKASFWWSPPNVVQFAIEGTSPEVGLRRWWNVLSGSLSPTANPNVPQASKRFRGFLGFCLLRASCCLLFLVFWLLYDMLSKIRRREFVVRHILSCVDSIEGGYNG